MNAQRIASAAGGIERLQRPDQIEPVMPRRKDMDFEPPIRRLCDRERFQDARPHDIPVPRDAQAMREFLVQPEPEGAGRQSHDLAVVLLLMKRSTGTSEC